MKDRTRLQRPATFVADAMLGSLARKLRIFGFDTIYFRGGSDRELKGLARARGRIILTSDRVLVAEAERRDIRAMLVTGRWDGERLRSFVEEAKKASIVLAPGESRCAICNGLLRALGKSQALKSLPEFVSSRHRRYYRCNSCGKLYWKGSHWRRLKRLALLLRTR